MTFNDQSPSLSHSHIRVLCVDDPAVRLYTESSHLVSDWSSKTGVSVECIVLPWDKYPETIFSALKSGSDEYDIVMLPGYFWLPGFAANGWLTPLTGLIASHKLEWKDYSYEDILPALRKELEIDDTIFLLPSFSEVQIVYYRKDLLDITGVTIPHSPVSIKTWLEITKMLHNLSQGIYGTHFKGAATESMVEWLPFFSEAGGILPDGANLSHLPEKATIESLRTLSSFLPYCRDDVGSSDNTTMFEMLTGGNVGIVNHWSGQLGPIMNKATNPFSSNYGFASLEHPWGTVWAFGIPSASQNKDAAFSCLLQLTGAKADFLQSEFSGSPSRKSSFQYSEAALTYPWFPALLECIERKNTFPSSPEFANVMGHLYEMSHKVFSGECNPEQSSLEVNRKLDLE